MIRTLWIVFSVCSVTLVLSGILGVGVLWSQGHLTTRRLREMRDILAPPEKETVVAEVDSAPVLPSAQEVLRERSLRVLSLNSLETEAGLLKTMLESERNGLMARHAELKKQKKDFESQLARLTEENSVAAREQARSVLLALPPADAADRIMQLSIEEDVVLMREMPEAKIALLLKELAPAEGPAASAGPAAKEASTRQQRAKEIFERISKGEPRQSIISAAMGKLQQADADAAASPKAN